jgi:hypothetical protein
MGKKADPYHGEVPLQVHGGSCDNKLEVKLEIIGKIAWYSLGFNLPGRSREGYKVSLVALFLTNCS